MSNKVVFNHRIYMVLGTIREMLKQGREATSQSVSGALAVRCEERGCVLDPGAVQACFNRMLEAGVLQPAKPGEAARLTVKGSLIADQLEGVNVWGPAFAAMSKEMLCATLIESGEMVSQHEATERLGYSSTAIRAGMAYWIGKGEAIALKVGNQIYYRKVSAPLPEEGTPKEVPILEKAPLQSEPPPAKEQMPTPGEMDPRDRMRQVAALLGVSEEYLMHQCLDAFIEKLRVKLS